MATPSAVARQALYRGQCNCPYWHGAFGGIYLPHLRNAIYNQLIAADNLLDQATGKTGQLRRGDRRRLQLRCPPGSPPGQRQAHRPASRRPPAGMMYELDVRTICHNLLATLARRPESYHRKVIAGPSNAEWQRRPAFTTASIFKQAGLDAAAAIRSGAAQEPARPFLRSRRDASSRCFAAKPPSWATSSTASLRIEDPPRRRPHPGAADSPGPRRRPRDSTSPRASRWPPAARRWKSPTCSKTCPTDLPLHFGVELNFAGLPSGADDRYFHDLAGTRLGQLGTQLDLHDVESLGLVDEWLGIDVTLKANRPSSIWTFPIETVSQSEGGFELVHQSVVVHPALGHPWRRRRPLVGHVAAHRQHRPRRIADARLGQEPRSGAGLRFDFQQPEANCLRSSCARRSDSPAPRGSEASLLPAVENGRVIRTSRCPCQPHPIHLGVEHRGPIP